jgi:hypothetical protein
MNFSTKVPEGWRMERRPIYPQHQGSRYEHASGSPVTLAIICRGDHVAPRLGEPHCMVSENGWICCEECSVEDMRSTTCQEVTTDELIGVEERVERISWHGLPTLKFEWWATRISARRKFVNGRCRRPIADLSYETFYRGRSWGRKRAERDLEAAKAADTV